MSPKIIDGFIFYNELELLNYRLNVLNDVVDYFIIVESTHTFVGKEKTLYYQENKELFNEFQDKIIYVIVDDLPYKYPNIDISKKQQWLNEKFQRNAISRGLKKLNLHDDDIIIISDLDEIVDPNTLESIKKKDIHIPNNIASLFMDMYYYNLNTKLQFIWEYPKILLYKMFISSNKTCSEIREESYISINNGGWHLSYFGDAMFIKNKLENFSHQEFNKEEYTNLENIDKRVKNNLDLFERNIRLNTINIKNNDYLPTKYDIYLTKYYV